MPPDFEQRAVEEAEWAKPLIEGVGHSRVAPFRVVPPTQQVSVSWLLCLYAKLK